MILRPVIASYSGESYNKIKCTLTKDYLDVIARITASPVGRSHIDDEILYELIEMHVVTVVDGIVKLNTAVFLEEDIRKIATVASALGKDLAERLVNIGSKLNNTSPEIKNFLGGIVGVSQGLSKLLIEENIAAEWKYYTGRYAQSKVDFDEVCEVHNALGQDLQNKSVLRGEQYTAVFIGPGGKNYRSLTYQMFPIDELKTYRNNLLKYLTDSYAMLISGVLNGNSLKQAAEEVNLFQDGKPRPIIITNEIFHRYSPVIRTITEITYHTYLKNLYSIFDCLGSTTAGQQGVPSENMMMHFWRYCRKALARKLYESGFFTDRVPVLGCITVFYENTIDDLNELLG